jgi:hypothetical protein
MPSKRENRRFSKFLFDEDRQWVIGPVIQQYQAALMAWTQAKVAFDTQIGQFQEDQTKFNQLYPMWERAEAERQQLAADANKTGMMPDDIGPAPQAPIPPVDPGPQPQPPPLFWRAQEFENHLVHVAEHIRWRKTPDYEKKCRENPQLDAVVQFHIDLHNQFVSQQQQQAMMAAVAQAQIQAQAQGGNNMGPAKAAGPPAAAPGQQGIAK